VVAFLLRGFGPPYFKNLLRRTFSCSPRNKYPCSLDGQDCFPVQRSTTGVAFYLTGKQRRGYRTGKSAGAVSGFG
jgi:hypothetical protein